MWAAGESAAATGGDGGYDDKDAALDLVAAVVDSKVGPFNALILDYGEATRLDLAAVLLGKMAADRVAPDSGTAVTLLQVRRAGAARGCRGAAAV